GDHLLVGVEADEAALRRDGDLAADLLVLLEPAEALLQTVVEGVGQGEQLDVLVGLEGLGGGAVAAATAAGQADFQQVASGGDSVRGDGEGAAQEGGGFQEVAAGRGGGSGHESRSPKRVGVRLISSSWPRRNPCLCATRRAAASSPPQSARA